MKILCMPSHVVIIWNELADQAARLVVNSQPTSKSVKEASLKYVRAENLIFAA